jgi:hypothetical protein
MTFANLPDWKEAALLTLQQLLPAMVIKMELKRELLASDGLALELVSLLI